HEARLGEVVRVDLGRDAQRLARHADVAQRRADLGLVAVHLRGVEGAVADVHRIAQRLPQHLALQRQGAEGALVSLLEVDVHDGSLTAIWTLLIRWALTNASIASAMRSSG